MGFWIFMLCMDLLLPVILLLFGIYFKKSGPKKINLAFGYRTRRSMMNQETWRFAHEYCGKLWVRLGLILAPLSILILLIVLGRDENLVGNIGGTICYVQVALLIGTIFFVERALRKNFDGEGRRKL